MISSVSSYDEELLTGAYANIGLIADKGWAFLPDDTFRKLNHTLWVQNYKLTVKYRENGNYQPRYVRDTISGSWLAQYGNYEYDEERERMYKPDDNIPVTPHTDFRNSAITEPWMLHEVEEHFARLSSRASLPLHDELLTQLRESPTTKVLDVPGKVTERITLSKWDGVLKKRYFTGKNSNGRDSAPSTSYSTTTDDTYCKYVEPEDYFKYPPLRYTVNNMAEMQLQINVTSDAVRDLWNPLKRPQLQQQQQPEQRQKHFQSNNRQQPLHLQSGRQQQHHLHSNKQQQYLQCGLQHQTLGMRTGRQKSYPESIGMMQQLPPPMLSAEVPEFFPKGPMSRSKNYQEQSVPLQFFPSSAERSYQEELFPYNRGHVPSCGNIFQNANIAMHSIPIQQVSNTSSTRPTHQWIQRPSPALHMQVPVCPPHQSICTSVQSTGPTIIQRRIQMADKIGGNMTQQGGLPSAPIPVYQRPPELYNDPSQRRKTQGVDFNNLILLTKNAMKARRNQSKNSQPSSSFILESRQPSVKSDSDVLQWLEKGYPKKAKDFVAVNILVSDFQNLEEKCDDGKTTTFMENIEDVYRDGRDTTSAKLTDVDQSSDAPTKRRLYRDVLTNATSTEVILENVFDKRYDELERQAMEQYRTSEECLALRYQELERQAMEQYKNTDGGGAGTSNSNSKSKNTSPITQTKGNQGDRIKSVTEDQDCFGSYKCSGFGHCSPIKDTPSSSEKGTPPPQQLTILRPESKPGISATYRMANHTQCLRSAIVTKSLTTLNHRFSRDLKNTTKGASGDKIDRTVQVSPKRRLILMSPTKLKPEARQLESSDLKETYAVRSVKTHVSGAYRKAEVIQTGGGDEHVTILRSPGVEGIRKQLFLADEELMDSSPESLGVRLLEPTELDEPCTKVDLVQNLKDKIIGVSSGMPIANIVDVAGGDEEECSASEIHQTIWQQQEKNEKFSNRMTRNKKKQCKPHNLVAVKEAKFNRSNTSPKKSITLLHREKKYEIALNDVVLHNNVPTPKDQRKYRKQDLKLKPRSECQEICPLTYLPLTTFENLNYHTDSSPCSSILFETVCYYVSLCSIAKVDTSKRFVHKDLYSFLDQLGFGTAPVYFENKICSENILMVRYYDTAQIDSHKICLMSPFRVLPLWDNSEVNDLREIINWDTTPQRMQTNNLSNANDYTQSYHTKFRHKAVCEVHFDFINLLHIIPPTHFASIILYEQSMYQDRKENIYYIMTDFEAVFPFDIIYIMDSLNKTLEYL